MQNFPDAERPAWPFVLLMAAIMSVVALSIDGMLPALLIIGEQLAVVPLTRTQYIISVFFAGLSLGQLLCGPLSDALGRRRLLFGSLLVYTLGTLVCALAPSLGWLLAGRLLQGFGAAGPYVSTVSIVRDRYQGAAMASVMSLVTMIFIMVPVIAPTLGQIVLALAGWREIFWVFFGYAVAIGVWAAILLPETLPPERRVPLHWRTFGRGLRAVLSTRNTLCYMLCAGCIFGILIGYLNSCLLIFREMFGVGDAFAIYFGVLAFTLGLASLLNSRLVRRHGMRSIVRVALVLAIGASIVLLGYLQFSALTLAGFMIYAFVLFFAMGLLFGNLNALAMQPMGDIAGMAAAVIGCLSSVVSISSGTLIGLAYNQTVQPLATGAIILGVAGVVLVWLAEPRPSP